MIYICGSVLSAFSFCGRKKQDEREHHGVCPGFLHIIKWYSFDLLHTWPEVMTIRPLASSWLSAIMLPLEKHRVLLLSISCKSAHDTAVNAIIPLIAMLLSASTVITRRCDGRTFNNSLLLTSAENKVRISPITCNPARKDIWEVDKERVIWQSKHVIMQERSSLQERNTSTLENRWFSIFFAIDSFSASGSGLSRIA
jgi:hypothetical protein